MKKQVTKKWLKYVPYMERIILMNKDFFEIKIAELKEKTVNVVKKKSKSIIKK